MNEPNNATFGMRIAQGFDVGKRLSVGIDPHDDLLSDWGLTNDAAGAEYFGRKIIAEAADSALCVKPQIAFFERFGSAGFKALESVLEDARQAGVLVIADVKRGDIGSTFDAYAKSWLSPGSPLEADAMTVHAYQGFGTLKGALTLVERNNKGVFVLAATSNPEAKEIQTARLSTNVTVAAAMVADATNWNQSHDQHQKVGSVGVVLGATLNLTDFEIDIENQSTGPIIPILAPGFGFQGAKLEEAADRFGSLASGLIVHESRSVLKGGSARLEERIRQHSEKIASVI
ncbi:MAG TPA: orotidine-5'-phosphate decarboxylase [Microbacteriaceae bacterium]|nr:orotidine-5'-phosphate decarboxylase [Microbacteriaceae bacterium]